MPPKHMAVLHSSPKNRSIKRGRITSAKSKNMSDMKKLTMYFTLFMLSKEVDYWHHYHFKVTGMVFLKMILGSNRLKTSLFERFKSHKLSRLLSRHRNFCAVPNAKDLTIGLTLVCFVTRKQGRELKAEVYTERRML